MEATGEDIGMVLHKIIPPNFDDAGLEDCALPPDSIHLAFLKAAAAVGCVSDPVTDPPSDALVGVVPERGPPSGPCANQKGGGEGCVGGGDLVDGERNEEDVEKKDDVVVVGDGGGGGGCGGCVDGVKGLKIGEERENEDNGGDDEDNNKKPTLVEGYFLNP